MRAILITLVVESSKSYREIGQTTYQNQEKERTGLEKDNTSLLLSSKLEEQSYLLWLL